jgi:hypothetical protein
MAKKALCVGINDYPFGEENDLRGCVNDALQWSSLLEKRFGFEVKRLLDAEATKNNIMAELQDLLAKAKAGDVLTFVIASHGTYRADINGDEPDYEDALCPYDVDSGNLILSSELQTLFSDLQEGVRLTAITDACYFASITRVMLSQFRRSRQLNPALWGGVVLSHDHMRVARKLKESKKKKPDSEVKEIILKACQSGQTAADTYIEGHYHGAMSYYAIKAIASANSLPTYAQLHKRLLLMLEDESYDQLPQLEGKLENLMRKIFT